MLKRTSRKLFLIGILSLVGVFAVMIVASSTGQINSDAGSSFAVLVMGLLGGVFAVSMIVGYVFSLFEQHAIEEGRGPRHSAGAANAMMVEERRVRITVATPDGATKTYRVELAGPSELKALDQLRAKGNRIVDIEDAT